MNKFYSKLLPATALILGGMAAPALAQVPLTGFAPYTENFNTLSTSTAQTNFVNNTTLKGVYAQAVLDGYGAYPQGNTPVPCFGNDGGQHPEANYYSFGTAGSTDRALGGIATTFYSNGYPLTGNGYVAMRFVNNTGRAIANLEVSYAMEQWYNSGKMDKAQLAFDYQVPATTFGGMMEVGAWTNVPTLGVAAPSTATMVASKNGNAPANRRVLSATINNLNLAVGKEVVLRWKYVMNKDSNGNGLSVDDVTVTPEAGTAPSAPDNIFYYIGTGKPLNDVRSWASKGNQTPGSFTAANQIFYITTSGQVALPGNLISGANSKLVIGDGSTTGAVSVTMLTDSHTPTTIDVASNGTLEIDGTNGNLPILGKLSPYSTVYYNTTRSDVTISCATFGNLKLSGNSVKKLSRNVSVYNTLSLASNSILMLGVYDLTVLKGGAVTTDGTAYVRTSAGGALRQTVSNNNTAVLFPVGQYTYNPAWLTQTATAIEDVFGISVSDSVFTTYVTPTVIPGNDDGNDDGKGKGKDKEGKGQPLPVSSTNVKHTWYISEADKGGSNVTMDLQSELPVGMLPSQVMVGHYHNDAWDDDKNQKGKATAVNTTSQVYKFTRTGVVDFSPFTLNTVPPKALPVTLVAFTANRVSSAVVCNWETATELHNDHFTVERSLDGQTFRALATVAGAGNSSTRHDYRWVDARPASTVAYYRLSQVDTDSTTTYSPVVAVQSTATNVAVTASPNPSTGPLVLTLNAAEPTTVTGTVVNVVGAQVLRFEQPVSAGYQAITLDLSAQPAGVYLLRVQTPQGLQTLRVAKQ